MAGTRYFNLWEAPAPFLLTNFNFQVRRTQLSVACSRLPVAAEHSQHFPFIEHSEWSLKEEEEDA
jgi:hypothetical protein